MRYLGIVTAIVVALCVFIFVSRYTSNHSLKGNGANVPDYGSAVNVVRETVRDASGEGQRKKWAMTQQMKETGSVEALNYNVDGQNAEVLVIKSDSMDITTCSDFVKSENGLAAAEVGFTSVSCRTSSNGVLLERPLRN